MTDPLFPEATIGPIVYITVGVLISVIVFLVAYIHKIRAKDENYDFYRLNMPKSRIRVLEEVSNGGVIQSDLPQRTNLSKATVSQSIKDLKEEDLIKRKKRGNSYLIEMKKESLPKE